MAAILLKSITFLSLSLIFIINSGCEASHNGKSLSGWAKQLKSGKNAGEAAKSLGAVIQDPKSAVTDKKRAYQLIVDAEVWIPEVFDVLEEFIIETPTSMLYLMDQAVVKLASSNEVGLDRAISLLDHPDKVVRNITSLGIQRAGLYGGDEVTKRLLERIPVFIRHLKRFEAPNDEGQTGGNIATIFARIGPEAIEAVPQLITLLEKIHERKASNGLDDSFLAGGCLMAIRDIGSKAKAAAPVLYKLLNCPDDGIVRDAAEALYSLGPSVIQSPELLKVAKNKKLDDMSRGEALQALSLVEGEVKFIPDLLKILANRSDGHKVREDAARTLASLRTHDEDRIFNAIHLQMKEDPNSESRKKFAYALSNFGSRAVDAIPLIAEDLTTDKYNWQEGAVSALGSIGPPAAKYAPRFYDILKGYDDDSGVHRKLVIVKALAKVGTLKDRAVQDCLSLIKGKYDYYGAWGAVVLRDLTPEANKVLGELKEIVKKAKEGSDLKRSLLRTIEILELEQKPKTK